MKTPSKLFYPFNTHFTNNFAHALINVFKLCPFAVLLTLLFFSVAVNCVWNHWVYGQCSKTCGNGTQIKTRTKQAVESNGGTCPGQHTETVKCYIQDCPGNLRIYFNLRCCLETRHSHNNILLTC